MREHFPIFKHHPDLIYLDTAATAHKPQVVIDAISQFYSAEYATVHRAAYRASLLATEKYHAARLAAQTFLNAASPEEIIFTRGTTDAINLVARTFPFQKGDEILISEMEHHSNLVPWQMAAQRTGATLRWIPVEPDGTLNYLPHLSPKVRLVALSHISNVTGTINPIAEIARAAHAHGALLLVDGAQAAPHLPIDVQALDCDFYAFSGHKCYGPTGIGILYGKRSLLETLPPFEGGGDMIEEVRMDRTTYQPPPLRFEAGTPITASAIGLHAALTFLQDVRSPDRENALREQAEKALRQIPGLHVIGSAPDKGPILTFHVDEVHPLDLTSFLDLKGIAVRSGHLCAQPLLRSFGLTTAIRASFGLYNTQQDVDLFVTAVTQSVDRLRGKNVF
jgi:cysteine desulfurase/selenocysteine lyase